jgi:CPA2 family monovalent cation:H+ antiporter-2
VHDNLPLVSTIAVSLSFALVGGVIAHRLRLPPLVGYLLAGIAVGPCTPGFVADEHLAPELAEIGVILLMFGVGMHFSIAELVAVRGIAIPGAVAQIGVATALGWGVSTLWGWPFGTGLVFGLALSVASTVVLLRALEMNGLLTSEVGRLAVGWLIVEDLAMVLALVVLPALAGSLGAPAAGSASASSGGLWMALAITLAKVTLFMIVMLVLGPKVLPWIFQRVAELKSPELFTLAVITLSLGLAYGSAVLFGVSFALGAFFAGLVVHESKLNHRIADELRPLQDTFAALFFVAVGMLFDPMIVVHKPFQVLAVVGIIIVGKSLAALAIVLLLRKPLSTALIVSAALAQIGEFSFILAALGLELKLLPIEGQSLIVAGALISITLNPAVFYLVSPLQSGRPTTQLA